MKKRQKNHLYFNALVAVAVGFTGWVLSIDTVLAVAGLWLVMVAVMLNEG